jgi:hypothetical protein
VLNKHYDRSTMSKSTTPPVEGLRRLHLQIDAILRTVSHKLLAVVGQSVAFLCFSPSAVLLGAQARQLHLGFSHLSRHTHRGSWRYKLTYHRYSRSDRSSENTKRDWHKKATRLSERAGRLYGSCHRKGDLSAYRAPSKTNGILNNYITIAEHHQQSLA